MAARKAMITSRSRWRSCFAIVGSSLLGWQVPGVVGAWMASSDRRAPPLLQRRPRWDRLRAGHDDGDTQGASIGEGGELRRVPFLSTTGSPVPDEIPKGPVKASTRSVPVVRLDLRGSAVKTAISRYQLAAMLKCPLRDLRVADPTFPGQYPSILARNGSIIFAISDVKAVVCANELLLFPTTPEVLSVVSKVQEKLAQKALGDEAEVPFEQMAIECCLRFVFQALLDSLRDLEPRLRKVLDSFRSDKHSFGSLLHSLLPLKNEMDELCQTVTEVCKCMNDVLLNDEDMALMYLTEAARNRGKARDPQDHQDIEMLFENYLLQVELIASELRDFQDEVRNTEEIVEIELDVMRNKLMRFELVLSITAFTVSLGALVTGVFGMNLLSGWETQPRTFWIVTGGIYSCMLVLVAGTLAFCRLLKLL